VIIDNDFGGDPDGLFQLAHHLLSPSVEIKGIIRSQHYKGGFYGLSGTDQNACSAATELLKVMHLGSKFTVTEGASSGLPY
jgi:purine nucleosidase